MMEDQQKRLFLALLLCAAAAVLWQMFIVTPPTPPPAQQAEGTGGGDGSAEPAQQATAQTTATAPGSGTGTGQASATPTMGEAPMAAVELLEPQQLLAVDFSAWFSNGGAVMVDHQILAPEQYIPRDDFGGVFPDGGEHKADFGVTLSAVPALSSDSPFELVEAESERVETEGDAEGDEVEPVYRRLVYRWTDGDLQVDKIFTADPVRPYVFLLDVALTDLSGRGRVLGDASIRTWADARHSEETGVLNPIANALEAACFVDEDLETEAGQDVAGQQFVGATSWAGVMDRYFLAAAAVRGEQTAEGCAFVADAPQFAGELRLGEVTLGPNETVTLELLGYVGPKASDQLSAAGNALSRSVEYGIFGFLAKPMRWVLTTFFSVIPNWGVAIILLTIVVKLLMFPLTHKSFKSMERMREIQPKLVELREKYKNDKAKLTEETMKLYREHNVNPLGCLPMFLQMPIYIALYRTIYSSVELYKADFALWITDLSQSDPYYILPVLMTATMFGQQLLMPSTVDNPQMKWVMRLMPIIFGVFMLVLPSGLVLYIFVSSLLGILQQWYIRRQSAHQRAEAATAAAIPESSTLTRQQRRQQARRQRG